MDRCIVSDDKQSALSANIILYRFELFSTPIDFTHIEIVRVYHDCFSSRPAGFTPTTYFITYKMKCVISSVRIPTHLGVGFPDNMKLCHSLQPRNEDDKMEVDKQEKKLTSILYKRQMAVPKREERPIPGVST